VGHVVNVRQWQDSYVSMEIVGVAGDAAYRNVRDPVPPTIYVPFQGRGNGALLVRTASDPIALAATLRQEVSRTRSDFVVRNAGTQGALVRSQLIRERLLATLSLFFAAVALLLAAVGLYGVLNYAVVQQRREIGIRMALGARAAHVVGQIATTKLAWVVLGAAIGLAAGLAFGRTVHALLFEVKATDPVTLAVPIVTLAAAALLATLPPAIRAVRIDPAETLRTE
jgi:ABC-type antimicrobial peptide transport system permease subunit